MSDIKQYMHLKVNRIDDVNNSNEIDKVFSKVGAPEVAIFDTFISEEFYSHHIHRAYPDCLKVLDLQDFHSLRRKRELLAKQLPKGTLGKLIF